MKFRKKPVVIEAFRVPNPADETTNQIPYWMVTAMVCGQCTAVPRGGVDIKTLEGTMRGNVGDWIIRGVKGELYPCKDEIFQVTYEPAGE